MLGRKGVANDLLRRHHEPAAERALNETQAYFGGGVVSKSAQNRHDRKARNRHREVALAPKDRLQPWRQRDDDHVGDDVGGHEPRALIGRGAEGAVYRGKRDVDDRRVSELHQRREHHGSNNEHTASAVFDDGIHEGFLLWGGGLSGGENWLHQQQIGVFIGDLAEDAPGGTLPVAQAEQLFNGLAVGGDVGGGVDEPGPGCLVADREGLPVGGRHFGCLLPERG